MRHESRGYSLIELWLVIGLSAVLLCAGASTLNNNINTQKLKAETKALSALIDRLSLQAIQKEQDIRIESHETGYTGYMGKICFLQGTLPRPLKFADGSAKRIILSAKGTATPATLRLSNGDKTCLVVISLRGRVRSQCL